MNIGIYIYDQAEVLDFSGPFEVFTTASRVCEEDNPFNVYLIGESDECVTARAGYKVIPHYGFHNHPKIDALLVAGGVHTEEIQKTDVIKWIALQAETATLVSSVCTGAFLLAKANLLQGRNVTTHWEDMVDLKNSFPQLMVVENARWVEDGNVITSGGISAGIDMSLYIVSKLHSLELANKTAKQMEFSWTRNSE